MLCNDTCPKGQDRGAVDSEGCHAAMIRPQRLTRNQRPAIDRFRPRAAGQLRVVACETVCKDKAGADESLKVVLEWIQNNASHVHANQPTVTDGSVIVYVA